MPDSRSCLSIGINSGIGFMIVSSFLTAIASHRSDGEAAVAGVDGGKMDPDGLIVV